MLVARGQAAPLLSADPHQLCRETVTLTRAHQSPGAGVRERLCTCVSKLLGGHSRRMGLQVELLVHGAVHFKWWGCCQTAIQKVQVSRNHSSTRGRFHTHTHTHTLLANFLIFTLICWMKTSYLVLSGLSLRTRELSVFSHASGWFPFLCL